MTSSQVTTKIIGLVWIILIARFLGDSGFGKLSFAMSFCAIFGILIEFGFSNLTTREVARDKSAAAKYLNNIVTIKVILSVVVGCLIFVSIWLLEYPHDTALVVYVVALSVIARSVASVPRSLFYAFERMEYPSIIYSAGKLFSLGLGIVFIHLNLELAWIASILLFEGLFDLGSVFFFINRLGRFRFRFAFDPDFWLFLFKNAAPFALAMLFGLVYFKIDIVMLSIMKNDAVVGWYSAGYRIMEGLIFIGAAFVDTVFPIFSRHYGISKESLQVSVEKSFRFLFTLSLPIAVGLFVTSDMIIKGFYTNDFLNSIVVLRLISIVLFFVFINYLSSIVLAAMDRQHLHFYCTVIGVLVNVTLNLVLIPRFAHVGASVATFTTQFMMFFIYGFMVLRNLSIRGDVKFIVKVGASCLLMGAIVALLRSFPLVVCVIVGVLVYVSFLFVFRTFSNEELSFLKEELQFLRSL